MLLALSAFGNVVAVAYSYSRVKQEIAKMRILPFSKFWAMNSRYDTPVGALILHWIFTVLVIVASAFPGVFDMRDGFTDARPKAPNYTQNDEAYNLVSNLFTYGHTWIGSKSFPPVKLHIPPPLTLTHPPSQSSSQLV